MQIVVENKLTNFQIDSGSPVSAISEGFFRKNEELSKLKLGNTPRVFRTYSGGTIIPKGILKVRANHKNKDFLLDLFVFPGTSAPIMGRNWLDKLEIIRIDKKSIVLHINSLNNDDSVKDLLTKYKTVFADKTGKCSTCKLSLYLRG